VGRTSLIVGCMIIAWSLRAQTSQMQSEADLRMTRDIEVAENILATMLRQESGRRNYFSMDVKGSYLQGHGVTLRLPFFSGNRAISIFAPVIAPGVPDGYSYSYSYSRSEGSREAERAREEAEKAKEDAKRIREKDQLRVQTAKERKQVDMDSAMTQARKRFMEVAKNFLADYGDVIGGLRPEERILITNRGDNFDSDYNVEWFGDGRGNRRQLMSVEGKRGDIEQLKQGKISRDEFMKRLKIVDAVTAESMDPDLEVFSSLFGRLYREDLSETYYAAGNINYERLKDFGVMYYMRVYSSNESDNEKFSMPTLDLRDLSKAERNKKVTELYPKFESQLKENIVEYGRTLHSLKDEEQLVFNVKLTKCEGCGIPAGLEVSIKSSALKAYSSGKATKDATIALINVKKTGVQ